MPSLSPEDQAKIEEWRAFERRRPEHIDTPGPGEESVWDYPRPPRVEPVAARLRVELAGQLIAKTERGQRVIETAGAPVYYFPPEDILAESLRPSDHSTLCEWKGRARYWHLQIGGQYIANAAFGYPDPLEGYEAIAGYLAFYPQNLDCYLNDELVRPQPGYFYAGWVSSGIRGPIKGAPGTEAW
jgi:uncharacterized protein (DUF427 family)